MFFPISEPVRDCPRCRAEATAIAISDPKTWVPECNGTKFVTEQNQNYTILEDDEVKVVKQAFCVNKWGKEYKGSRVDGTTVNCDAYQGMYNLVR